jgi:hypothetical protein
VEDVVQGIKKGSKLSPDISYLMVMRRPGREDGILRLAGRLF